MSNSEHRNPEIAFIPGDSLRGEFYLRGLSLLKQGWCAGFSGPFEELALLCMDMCTIHSQSAATPKVQPRKRLPERLDPVDKFELGTTTPTPEMRRPYFASPQKPDWIERSDKVTQQLLDIGFQRSPEDGSSQGLSQYDREIFVPTYANDLAYRQQLRDFKAGAERALVEEKDGRVAQDLRILVDSAQQNLDDQEF